MLNEREKEKRRAITGFQSPAGDYQEFSLDITRTMVRDRDNTYYQKMDSDAMTGCGIVKGAILVIDRSITPQPGDVIAAWYNNELYVRSYDKINDRILLHPNNPKFKAIEILDISQLIIDGVVTWNNNCHCHREFPEL